MFITKCDICKKEVGFGSEVRVDYSGISGIRSFCQDCAKPVIKFLKNQGFLKNEVKANRSTI